MRTSPVARRYATALVEATAKTDPRFVDKIADELEAFTQAIEVSKDLRQVLMNPAFALHEKQRSLVVVAKALGVSRIATRFVGILVENERIGQLGAIADSVRVLADERAGRVRVKVEAAADLTPAAQASLKGALEKRTGKSVEMTVQTDPRLLGGVRATIGGQVFDGTIRAQLDQLRETLEAAQ